jgi:hypothetical protein
MVGLVIVLSGCGTSAPYYLIESRLVESAHRREAPDVTETPQFRAMRAHIATIGLQPPDVCADQGASAGDGTAQLELGILRTRCGVEMAELERALARAGYGVVSWGAVQHMARSQETSLLESARALGVDVLLQVNALERIEVRPGRDARFERRFYHATRGGERAQPASVPQTRARTFEELIGQRETSLATGTRVGAAINVSAVEVDTGATVWFYEWSLVDVAEGDPSVELLLDCQESSCVEVEKPKRRTAEGPVQGSISGISVAGDPADERQAIFHELVRSLVTDLAERFAGRRS